MSTQDIHQGTFIFNGVNSEAFGVWIKGSGVYNAPERRYESIDIPGRNGLLTLDGGAFREIEHTYPAFIYKEFDSNIAGLRNALLADPGCHRLEDSYHSDEYYLARYVEGLEASVFPLAVAGEFDLKFTRDPRRFLKSGDIAVTVESGKHIDNPTLFPANPLIRVTGYGTLYVGDRQVTVAQHFEYVDIDCEMLDCYCGTANANSYVTIQGNDFPELPPGRTYITYSGNITEVKITPRWWRV